MLPRLRFAIQDDLLVPNRKNDRLQGEVRKHVGPGSAIYSDRFSRTERWAATMRIGS